jgi:MFS family permease
MGGFWKAFDEKPVDHWVGFVVSFAAFFTQASLWGVRATISTFANAINSDPHFCSGGTLEHPCSSPHLTATAAGIAMGLGPVCGVAAGTMTERLGASTVVAISAVLIALSLVACTFAENPILFVVLYAPLMGVGSGFMVTPGAVAAGTRFAKYVPIGMGIVYAGGGFGSAFLPRIAGGLLDHFGESQWRVAQRWLAISTVVGFAAAFLVRTRTWSAPPVTLSEAKSLINNEADGTGHDEPPSAEARAAVLCHHPRPHSHATLRGLRCGGSGLRLSLLRVHVLHRAVRPRTGSRR